MDTAIEKFKPSLKNSLFIQWRVIKALFMREIITRYGRKNIGFLWLFIEPLMLTFIIVLMWKYYRGTNVSNINIVAFTITGYPILMMWRNAAGRAIGALGANIGLLYHRNVKPLDVIITRILLEIIGATIAQILIMAVFVFIGWIEPPADIFYMLMAWFLMGMFAFGLGFIICSIAYYFEPFAKIWTPISFITMPISGAFFLVHTLPHQFQQVVVKFPMVNGTEMFRQGYFGYPLKTYESISYMLIVNISMILIGLLLIKHFSRNGVDIR